MRLSFITDEKLLWVHKFLFFEAFPDIIVSESLVSIYLLLIV